MRRLRPEHLVAIAVVIAASSLAASACGSSRGDHPAPGPAFERLRSQPPAETAATVDGHPLGHEEFRTVWEANREWSADRLIDEVIDREIAVQRAVEQGYHRDDDLGFIRKKGMVRALLHRQIEEKLGPEDLDDKLVEQFETKLRRKLGHPRGIRASHLLVMIPQKKKVDKEKLKSKAKPWIERIRRELPAKPSVEDLFFARRTFREKVPDPLKIVVNAHLSFPGPDARTFRGKLPNKWMRVVPAFAKAADGLLADDRAGELSEPVESKYGWHLVLAEKRLEGKVPDPEILREVAVSRALRLERARRFKSKLDEWRQGMSVAGYPQAIADQAENEAK